MRHFKYKEKNWGPDFYTVKIFVGSLGTNDLTQCVPLFPFILLFSSILQDLLQRVAESIEINGNIGTKSDQEIPVYGLNGRIYQYGLIHGICGSRDEAEILFFIVEIECWTNFKCHIPQKTFSGRLLYSKQ